MDTRRPTTAADVAGRPHPGAGSHVDPDRVRDQATEQFQTARDEARSVGRQVSDGASDAAARAKDAVGSAAEQAQRKAADYARQAQEHGRAMIDQQRLRAAGQVRTAAEAAQRAADRFREEHDHNIAGYIQAFGDEVNRLGDYLERRDVSGLWRDTQSFARRRPELFLGGMFVAGLALSRFLKASTDYEPNTDYEQGRDFGPRDAGNWNSGGRGVDEYEREFDYARYRVRHDTGSAQASGASYAAAETPAQAPWPSTGGVTAPPPAGGTGSPVGDAAAGSGPAAGAAATGISAVTVRAPAVYTMDIPTSGAPAVPTDLDEPTSDARRLPPEVH